MSEPAMMEASPFFSSYADPPCYDDPCFDDLPVPDDLGEFNFDLDFSIDEYIRSPDRSGNGSTVEPNGVSYGVVESPDSVGPNGVESPESVGPNGVNSGVNSPDSAGCSNESDVTSNGVKQEEENKANWGLKRKNRSGEEEEEDIKGLGEEDDEKKKARLIRNRESAQLSRQRKKKYVEELEEKVKSMHSVINDLNSKISFFMAENASLRQQIGGNGVNLGHPGVYPPPGMHFPWIPSYALRPHGGPAPLVPIPRVKPQTPAPAQKPKKESSKKAKKVAGVSILGLIFLALFCGAVFPAFNASSKFDHKEGIVGISHERLVNSSVKESGFVSNSSESLPAMLYVPRNGKHVEINGNLIIHSVLASEKAMNNKEPVKKDQEMTSLAVANYMPFKNYGENSKSSSLPDSPVPQWFREGMAGPILGSGMCTEVFQFETSTKGSSIIPAKTVINTTNSITNSTESQKIKGNRRIMYNNAIPLPGKTLNNESTTNPDTKPASKVVVSVLADPREVSNNEGDNVSPKSLSRVFVVVLLDGVKYVTYSCVLPFKNSASHLVKY